MNAVKSVKENLELKEKVQGILIRARARGHEFRERSSKYEFRYLIKENETS